MKNLLLLFITIFCIAFAKRQSETIIIEHVGESDKPIRTIIISKESIRESDSDSFIVDKEIYNRFVGIIKLAKPSKNTESNEFGSFKFRNREFEKCYSRKESIAIINSLVESLKGNSDNDKLLQQLEINLKRISY